MTQTAQISNLSPAPMMQNNTHVAPHVQAAHHAFYAQAPMTEAMQRAGEQEVQASAEAPDRSGVSGSVGSFIHHNKNWMTNYNPIGNAGYHWLRSAVACVPYGLMCGVVFAGTKHMEKLGALTEKINGIEKALPPEKINKGWAALTNTPFFEFAAQSAMVGTAFTLYRTTSFAGRRFYERVFNQDNTEKQTIDELKAAPLNFADDLRKNFDIQSHSVPWAAITLGSIMVGGKKLFALAPGVVPEAMKAAETAGIYSSKPGTLSKMTNIQEIGLATFGYGSFFEIADQLGKRRRERAGIADPTKNINDIDLSKIEPGKVQDILDQPKSYGFFTDESGWGRWVFRRMLPVTAGVGAYVLMKPHATTYIAEKLGVELAGPMGPNAPIWKNAIIEGGATSLFASYTFVKDPWERAYDNLFNKLERKANPEFYKRKDELDQEGVELRVELRKKTPQPDTAEKYTLPTVPVAPAAAQIQTPAQLEGQAKAASEQLEK